MTKKSVTFYFVEESSSSNEFINFKNINFHFSFPVDAIKIDLPRTFPDNIFFEGIKHKLLNILLAYAQHNKEIGYCQGLNYIAGMHLMLLKWNKISIALHFLIHRLNSNCNQKRRMVILAAESIDWIYSSRVSHENNDRPDHGHRCAAPIAWGASAKCLQASRLLWFANGCDCHQVVYLSIRRSIAYWDGIAHLGLPIFGGKQGTFEVIELCQRHQYWISISFHFRFSFASASH